MKFYKTNLFVVSAQGVLKRSKEKNQVTSETGKEDLNENKKNHYKKFKGLTHHK
jgi:hypothetical protein